MAARYRREDGRLFQYASIKIGGHDVLLMVDAVPDARGRRRGNPLPGPLDGVTDLLPELNRESVDDSLRDAYETRDVHHLSPGVVRSSSDHEAKSPASPVRTRTSTASTGSTRTTD